MERSSFLFSLASTCHSGQTDRQTAAQVRLGEMQSLEVLGGSMKAHARRLKETLISRNGISSAALTVRPKPCSMEHTLALLDHGGGGSLQSI